MKLVHQIFLAFAVILVLVIVGFAVNLHGLLRMVKAQEMVDEEWREIKGVVEIQTLVDRIGADLEHLDIHPSAGKDLVWNINLLEDKVGRMSEEMKEESVERPTGHHDVEEDYFGDFVTEMSNFVHRLPNSRSKLDIWSLEFQNRAKESLLNAERATYRLQQADLEQMLKVARQAEEVREKNVRWSIAIFVLLILTIILFSLWFIRLFRKKTDDLIRDEQHLAVALMAQSLAHEIRNPLGIIKSSTSVLKKKLDHDQEGKELIGYLNDEIDRIDDLLKQLYHMSESATEQRLENMSDIVHAVCALMRPQAEKSGIALEFIDRASGEKVSCNIHQIKQLLINLILNALQASERGKSIRIETVIQKGIYRLSVTDHGSGMDEKTRAKIFQPFFTTKTQGAGLGLVVVKRIVDWHRGRIDVVSKPGTGTTFDLSFPLERAS